VLTSEEVALNAAVSSLRTLSVSYVALCVFDAPYCLVVDPSLLRLAENPRYYQDYAERHLSLICASRSV
jgi:hypothetical protein